MTMKNHHIRRSFHPYLLGCLCSLLMLLMVAPDAHATRIKDIAYVQGVRDNQLLGYGLVVGLDGTGDFGRSEFTVQSTASMLSRMGIKVDKDRIQTRNVAAVMVTADLPPFSRSGQRLDVVVSSLGNARSLQGGTLLMTPLMGPDGAVYAVAQGALSIGGFSVREGSGNVRTKNHVNVGRIPNGAIVERSITIDLNSREHIRLILHDADFSTAVNVANAVNVAFPTPEPVPPAPPEQEEVAGQNTDDTEEQQGDGEDDAQPTELADTDAAPATPDPPEPEPQEQSPAILPGQGIAQALDSATVSIEIPEPFQQHVPQFIAFIESLQVQRDTVARVIINERTGTVVLGGNVRISEVAVAHGNIHVRVSTRFEASQPSPFQVDGAGETVVLPDTEIDVIEEPSALSLIPESATIGDVVTALNAIGATPRDLIAIMQAIKAAGALHAHLEIQ